MAQLSTFARQLSGQKVNVFVISASGEDDLEAFPKAPFHLLADPDLKLFKAYGVADGGAQHATIVLDAEGAESFRNVGEKPLQDASLVLRALQGPRIDLAQ
jgi:peroxiredoxin